MINAGKAKMSWMTESFYCYDREQDDSLVILMESRAFKAIMMHGNAIDVGAFGINADLRRVMGKG